jgi:hypothetical protein
MGVKRIQKDISLKFERQFLSELEIQQRDWDHKKEPNRNLVTKELSKWNLKCNWEPPP